ncbi:MAG: hypothetical protein ACE5L6_05325 [Candidatus Bathyarchaeia archaeon]
MILGLTLLLVLALGLLVLVLFLPAVLELRKPKDPGPREIAGISMEEIPRYTRPSATPSKRSHIVKEYALESLLRALTDLEEETSKPSLDMVRLAGEVELPSDIEKMENVVVLDRNISVKRSLTSEGDVESHRTPE